MCVTSATGLATLPASVRKAEEEVVVEVLEEVAVAEEVSVAAGEEVEAAVEEEVVAVEWIELHVTTATRRDILLATVPNQPRRATSVARLDIYHENVNATSAE